MSRSRQLWRGIWRLVVRSLVLTLLGGFLSASLAWLAPGRDADEQELDGRLSAETQQALRSTRVHQESLISFYLRWWQRAFHGDLGVSVELGEPVAHLLEERVPETIKNIAFGLGLAWAAGLGLAAISISRWQWLDMAACWTSATILCIPLGVIALLCVLAQVPGRFAIGAALFPKIFQYARNLLMRSSSMMHVMAARSRGTGEMRIFCHYVLRVSAPQLLALCGVSVSLALAAAIPVEALCDLPGIGQLAWRSALSRDLPLLVNLTLLVTLSTLAANSIAELMGGDSTRRRA